MKARKWLSPIGFTLIIIAIIWLWVSEQAVSWLGGTPQNQALWETGWHVQAGDAHTRDFTAPMRLQGTEDALYNVLPDIIPTNACLYIKTNNQVVTATVDGQAIPTLSIAATGNARFTSDLPWTALRLSTDMAGKPVSLRFSGTGSKPFIEVYSIRFSTQARIQLTLLHASLSGITQSVLLSIFALALFLYASMAARRVQERLSGSYGRLLLFVVVIGVWFYTCTDISAVNYIGNAGFLMVNVFSCMLLVPVFLLFAVEAGSRWRRTTIILSALMSAALAALFLLWYTGVIPLWMAMISEIAIASLICLSVVYLSLRTREPCAHQGTLRIGILLMAGAGVLTILAVFLTPVADDTFIVRHVMLVFLVTLSMSILDANADLLINARKFEQLRVREEEYCIAVRQSDRQVVRYDVHTHTVLQGEGATRLLGDAREIPDMPDAALRQGMVAQESVAEFSAFFDSMLAGKPLGTAVLRLRNADGGYAWYRADFTMIYTDNRQPLHAVITFSDITQRRERELAYHQWRAQHAGDPADGSTRIEFNLTRDMFTGEAGTLLPPLPAEARRSLATVADHLADSHTLPADDQMLRAFLNRDRLLEAFARGTQSDTLEFRRMDADTRALWTEATAQLAGDPYSGDVHAVLTLRDMDEQKRDNLQKQTSMNTDPLTGLLTRRAFEEQFEQLLSQAGQQDAHALILIDLDGFKRVNDVYGHHFGDRVLIDIAGSLRAMMRADDLIGRMGGDEFMVCLKNVRDSKGFLERRSAYICQALGKQFDTDVVISGSVGVARYPRDGATADHLYDRAGKALQYAKLHGKNRYVVYHDSLFAGEAMPPDMQPSPPPAAALPVGETPAEPQRTLLIVDDVEMNRDLLAEIFQNEYRLLFANGGQMCLDILMCSETPISAVLLDLIMPDMNGLSVLERIQNDAYMATIPVIVTSAADELEYSLKAIELGATDFISKPIDPRLVRLRVQNAVHKRETDELRAQNRYLLVQKSDENRHQVELRYMAEHDPLTNINNKATFYRKTRSMIDQAPDTQFVMIAMDIERFRLINDIFGHEEGDRLLHYIAQRMQALYAGQGTFSRIDADNFALCLPYDTQALKRRIIENEVELKEYDLPFDIVLVYGLYIIDDRTLPVSIMHDRAEMAKRTVKGNYVQRFAFYDDTLRQAMLGELDIVNNMDAALREGQFEVYLQPKCSLGSGEIVGAEALVRWNHPTRGTLAPGAFVPIFERNGFIMKLDAWVWEQVCRLMRKWMDANGGQPLIPVSMNVSRISVYNPALVTTLAALADRYDIPRRMLELEITESAYAEDPKQLYGLVTELRTRGFPVQMDDFGSAYSSLNMLKEISVDLLKLDMRFLYGSDTDGRGGVILSSVVRMARHLALPIIAEGVETAEQARFLHSIGLAVAQGYYYYRPMPVPAFEALLAQNPQKPIGTVADAYPEATVRRLWSIDGDFSLMLATIPCAASLCELSGERIEILRINDEYLAMTGDSLERIYTLGTDVRSLTTPQNYQVLLALCHSALEKRGSTEGEYTRIGQDGGLTPYHVKISYLSGDQVRALFFITYNPLGGYAHEN
jgi:diguanylate cyclase (GGDEF)-like protein